MLLICDIHENVKIQVGQGDPKNVSKITIIVCVCENSFSTITMSSSPNCPACSQLGIYTLFTIIVLLQRNDSHSLSSTNDHCSSVSASVLSAPVLATPA